MKSFASVKSPSPVVSSPMLSLSVCVLIFLTIFVENGTESIAPIIMLMASDQ